MSRPFIIVALFMAFIQEGFSQGSRTQELYGKKGLAITEQILSELNLPEWLWGDALDYDTLEKNYRLVDGELLDSYFQTIPAGGLNDPQQLLDRVQREKLEEVIASHDMKSAMPLYVNVLAYGQKIAVNESEVKGLLSEVFYGKNALVVIYYLGHARGAHGYVILDGQGFVEDWEVDELFLRSAQDASLQVGKHEEILSFVTEFSKRSFWLEQRLITPVMAEKDVSVQEDEESKQHGKLTEFLSLIHDHSLSLFLFLFVLLIAGRYYLWSTRWRKYVMPDVDIAMRQGAKYGANVSDSIDFSDPKISLSDQYEKIKNREL